MYSLETIKSINARATAKASRNTDHLNREPSRCRSFRGLVLHSATLRSTVFFDFDNPAAERDADRVESAFTRYEKDGDLKKLNRFVDSFFS
jgi:hypothetical protein